MNGRDRKSSKQMADPFKSQQNLNDDSYINIST